MNGQEIREKIIANNKELDECVTPGIFVLNEKVKNLLAENRHLREICPHEFDELGYCVFCDTKVE